MNYESRMDSVELKIIFPQKSDYPKRLSVEKLFRPKVFKTLKGSKLVHVSKAGKIKKALDEYFLPESSESINILPGVSLYIIKNTPLKVTSCKGNSDFFFSDGFCFVRMNKLEGL